MESGSDADANADVAAAPDIDDSTPRAEGGRQVDAGEDVPPDAQDDVDSRVDVHDQTKSSTEVEDPSVDGSWSTILAELCECDSDLAKWRMQTLATRAGLDFWFPPEDTVECLRDLRRLLGRFVGHLAAENIDAARDWVRRLEPELKDLLYDLRRRNS